MMTIRLPCQRGHKNISTCEDQSPPMSARTQNISQLELNTYKIHARKKRRNVLTKLIPCQQGINSTCIEQSPPMSARTKNSSKHAHMSARTKNVTKNFPMPARTENASHPVFTKPLLCHRGQKCL